MIDGDALLYDLSDLSFLGGFPFTAKSSDNVRSTTYGNDSVEGGLRAEMARDFREQIKKAVLYGILDRLPKERIYMNGNLQVSVMQDRGGKSE